MNRDGGILGEYFAATRMHLEYYDKMVRSALRRHLGRLGFTTVLAGWIWLLSPSGSLLIAAALGGTSFHIYLKTRKEIMLSKHRSRPQFPFSDGPQDDQSSEEGGGAS